MPNEQERLQHALALAYRYLNRRERTKSEVRQHLEQKGVDATSSERALELLSEEGSVDDPRFARLFAQDKRELEEWGRERTVDRLITDKKTEESLSKKLLRVWLY